MIYLLANIVFASAFMLTIKWVQVRKREDIITVGAINYIVGLLAALPEFLSLTPGSDAIPAVITGGVMGICYFVCYFFVIYSIRWIGAASSTVIAVLSILLPIGCGIFIWGEHPNRLQVTGIGLALMALTLIGAPPPDSPGGRRPWFAPLVLVTFFLLAGSSRLAQEAFKHESLAAQRPVFLVTAFFMAALPSLVLLIVRGRRVRVSELIMGAAMGLSNVLQTHFILKSLQYFDGFVVFPVASAGGLVLTTLVATGLLGERLTRKTVVGIALAVVALFFLNWLPDDAASFQSHSATR